MEQVKAYVHTIQFFFQGEPLLNQELHKMIALAHEQGIYTIVSTNAQTLTPLLADRLIQAGLNRIIVSIDGLSQDRYEAYRQGGSLHRALDGLTQLNNAKLSHNANIHIELQCLRLKTNEQDWPMLLRSYKKMGADSLTLKTAQLYNYEQGHLLMPTDTRYSRYRLGRDGLYHMKRRMWHKCRRIYMGAVVDVDGNLRPCCYDKEGQHIYGNIYNKPLQECWFSEEANRFRKMVLHHRNQIAICSNCTE